MPFAAAHNVRNISSGSNAAASDIAPARAGARERSRSAAATTIGADTA